MPVCVNSFLPYILHVLRVESRIFFSSLPKVFDEPLDKPGFSVKLASLKMNRFKKKKNNNRVLKEKNKLMFLKGTNKVSLLCNIIAINSILYISKHFYTTPELGHN